MVTWEDLNIQIEGIVPHLNEGSSLPTACLVGVLWASSDGRYNGGQVLTMPFLLHRQSTHLTPPRSRKTHAKTVSSTVFHKYIS